MTPDEFGGPDDEWPPVKGEGWTVLAGIGLLLVCGFGMTALLLFLAWFLDK